MTNIIHYCDAAKRALSLSLLLHRLWLTMFLSFTMRNIAVNQLFMDARSAMRPCYILPMFF